MRKPKYHFEVHWDKKQNLNVAKCIEMPMCEGLGLTENAAITDAKNAIRELSKTEAMEERVSKHRKHIRESIKTETSKGFSKLSKRVERRTKLQMAIYEIKSLIADAEIKSDLELLDSFCKIHYVARNALMDILDD